MRPLLTVATLTLASCTCGGGGIIPKDFPARAAATICTKMYGCCMASELANNDTYGPDQPTCETNVKKALDHTSLLEMGITNTRLTWHSDKAADCLTQYEALSCEQLKSNATTSLPACDTYIEPRAALGTACSSDFECVGGACRGEAILTDGTCEGFLPENADCGDGGTCAKTMYCDTAGKTCKLLKGDGTTCKGNFECSTGGCNGPADGGTRTCGQKGGPGTTCYATDGCSAAPAGSLLLATLAVLAVRRRRNS